jgi:hypothetical protein
MNSLPFRFQHSRFFIHVAIGLIACTLIGCGDANRGKIIGTWEIEQADSIYRKVESNADLKDEQSLSKSVDSASSKMSITFQSNGILATNTNIGAVSQSKEGTWKFESFDEASGEMKLACVLMDQASNHKVTFVDEDTIKLIPPNMAGTKMKLKFVRKKQAN